MATVRFLSTQHTQTAIHLAKLHIPQEESDDTHTQTLTDALILPFNVKFVQAAAATAATARGGATSTQTHTQEKKQKKKEKEKETPTPTETQTQTHTHTPQEQQQQQEYHPTTIFLTGLLNWSGGDADLRSVFDTHTPTHIHVTHTHIAMDKRTGKRKGTALVQFNDPEGVSVCVSMSDLGKKLGVDEVVKVRRSRFPALVEEEGEGAGGDTGTHTHTHTEEKKVVSSRSLTSFAPRVLMRRGGGAGGAGRGRGGGGRLGVGGGGSEGGGGGNLTQEDFKKMLMKK